MMQIKNEKKYSVLHIATTDLSVVKLLKDKLAELQKYNYSIETMSGDIGFSNEINKSDMPHHTIKISRSIEPIKDIKSIIQVYKVLRSKRFDIVHTHTAKAGFIGRVAARAAGVPIIIHTSHGLPFYNGQSFIKKFIYRKLEQIASFFSDGYLSQTHEDLGIIKPLLPKRVLTGYEGNGIAAPLLNNYSMMSENEKKEKKKT